MKKKLNREREQTGISYLDVDICRTFMNEKVDGRETL